MTRTTPASGRRNGTRNGSRRTAVEVFRVKFPHGMDANEYACKVKPADKSLALLLNAAEWMGSGARPMTASQAPVDKRPRPLFL